MKAICQVQRDYFNSGATRTLAFRQKQLQSLLHALEREEAILMQALGQDLGKPPLEAYASEVGFVRTEIRHTLKRLKKWMRPKKVATPILHWPARSYIIPEPKGQCLIISPWNYPLQLCLAPLVAALAAGNTAVVKPSELAPHTAKALERFLKGLFGPELVAVVQGEGQERIPPLIDQGFDHIFFTGSTAVGRKIAAQAAHHLTPVTLELGGKSPAIVERSAKLAVAARRIAFGKWLNAGQTCVAPDYLLLHEDIAEEFLQELVRVLQQFYPRDPLHNADYGHIINEEHYRRLLGYMRNGTLYHGGESDGASRKISPTILYPVDAKSPLMQEEIFGPLLPVITFRKAEQAQDCIRRMPEPLALYIFAERRAEQEPYWRNIPFGGGAVNNTVVHLSNPNLPFGGIGNSGMGSYHGEAGFRTFSHYKSLMKSATWFDPAQKYPPYGRLAMRLLRRVMR